MLYPAELREQNLYFINAIQQPNVGLCQSFPTVAKRLKENQKLEILEGYRLGKSSIDLALEHGCTPNTVIRTVKAMLPAQEYKSLKKSRVKENDLKIKDSSQKTKITDELKKVDRSINDFQKVNSKSLSTKFLNQSPSELVRKENDLNKIASEALALDNTENFDDEISTEDNNNVDDILRDNNQTSIFKELVPLVSDFGFEERQQKVPLKELSSGILPEIIYMLVDKTVELELISLNDLPQWSFLPESEKERQVISLFATQRAAKRNCSRGQRVIKVPDSNVFVITKHFLLSKGITRLVLEDSLIALD